MKNIKSFKTAILAAILCFISAAAYPAGLEGLTDRDGNPLDIDATADSYEYVGDNLIATGNVTIEYGDMRITCDKAIINLESHDLEAAGNVTFSSLTAAEQKMTAAQYDELITNPFIEAKVLRRTKTPTGEEFLVVATKRLDSMLKSERALGNLKSGTVQFKNFALKSGLMYATGESAERDFNGKITVKNTKLTTCEYIVDGNDHYAVYAKKAVIKPREAQKGLYNYNPDHGDHSLLAQNTFFEIWGVPILWLPVLYKPSDISSFGGVIEFGNTSEWGYYVRTSKNFQLFDEPYVNTNFMLDYYSDRGIGYGVSADILTPESATEMFFYGISDRNPYYYWEDDYKKPDYNWRIRNSRLTIPEYRYEFKLANLTHLTPNLDFRGQVDVISDYNFLNDYFERRYDQELEPPTFASLDYQADRFTASLYLTVRVNDFYSVVQRLPEFRLDFQRQELFGGLYYQSETTASYLDMNWRNYDYKRLYGNKVDPEDYHTGRFDTIHMLFYPFKVWNINVNPRAGIRLTAYSNTSDKKIDYADLTAMFLTDTVDGQPRYNVENYDNNGGSKLRVTGEIGVEVNTKIYRSWQDVKSAYFELDGLRHVMIPYLNYTYIPNPNVNRDNLYYFDDADRLDEQNFIRFGLVNRLQTRRNGEIYEWLSLENYWDYFFYREGRFNHIGDLGTLLKFRPFKGLTLSSELLLDLGQAYEHDAVVRRAGRDAGRPGLSGDFIDRWYNTLDYRFAPGWRVYGSYIYSDAYNQRSIYSMGSMFTQINATSAFETAFERHQTVGGGIEFPTYIDKSLSGRFSFYYDVDAALMQNMAFGLTKKFHCWQLDVEAGRDCNRRGSDNDKEYTHYISFFVSLTAMPGAGFGRKVGN